MIDLRKGKRPPEGQAPLFRVRPVRVPESPKKPMPLRAKRRRVRAALALAVLLLCGGIFWGVSEASYLPRFNVTSISISGAAQVPERLILRYAESEMAEDSYHILSRTNVLTFPREELERAIVEFFPRIKSATVSRPSMLATAAAVSIEERQPFARWCARAPETASAPDEDCYIMDEGGFIFAKATSSTTYATHYVFEGGLASSTNPVGEWYLRAHLAGMVSLFRFLGQAGLTPEGANAEGGQDFSVRLEEGFLLKASFGADAGTLAKNLQLVLSSDALKNSQGELEYVDLRFGNRVYYKLKGQEAVAQ